jgi:hypothetical protein
MADTAAGYDGDMNTQIRQTSGTDGPALSVAAPILPDRFSGVSTPGTSAVPAELRSTSEPR